MLRAQCPLNPGDYDNFIFSEPTESVFRNTIRRDAPDNSLLVLIYQT